MKSLEWCLLAKTFYAFMYIAERLGFYVPELKKMEESLIVCRPFKDEKSINESIKSLCENNNFLEDGKKENVLAVHVRNVDGDGNIDIYDKRIPEWFEVAKDNNMIFVGDNSMAMVKSITDGTTVVLPGDFIVYHADGQLEVIGQYEFAVKYNRIDTI